MKFCYTKIVYHLGRGLVCVRRPCNSSCFQTDSGMSLAQPGTEVGGRTNPAIAFLTASACSVKIKTQ